MRESIGGTWLLSIVITFIALFSAFLSYAISYTKAFNMKSEILNMIERAEGWTQSPNSANLTNMKTEDLEQDGSVEAQAFLKVKGLGYNYQAAQEVDCSTVDGHTSKSMQIGGYCLTKYCPNKVETVNNETGTSTTDPGTTSSKTYYKVTTFIAIKIPVINYVAKIPITGETRTLFHDQGDISPEDCIKG